MSEDFFVFLSSNVKEGVGLQTNNTISNFVTQLPEKLELSNEYEVALTDVSYSKTWFNLNEEETIRMVTVNPKVIEYTTFKINAGIYISPDQLVLSINTSLKEATKDALGKSIEKTPILSFDAKRDKFSIYLGYSAKKYDYDVQGSRDVILVFSDNLSEMLGFVNSNREKLCLQNYTTFADTYNDFKSLTKIEALYCQQIEPIQNLYIYSDILSPRIVGNVKAPLFRQVEVPKNISFGDDVFVKYKKWYYHPLNHYEFDSIRINIKDDTGENIDFKKGRVSACLHFRKVSNITKTLKKFLK